MGLTQTGLAKLGGLSRATVNQIENGAVNDLSLVRAARLLSVLGLTVNVSSPRSKHALKTKVAAKSPALELAARTSSVSYAIPLPARQLRDALVSGTAPARFEPHVATLLDEAPVSLLAAVVEQVHTEKNVTRAQLWKHLRAMAKSLKSDREIWK